MAFFYPIIILSSVAGALAALLALLDRYIATYGECNITINEETDLVVQGGENLLVYLLQNKIFIPSACGGKATCGFCKVRVLEGGGPLLPTEKPFLNKAEIRQLVRLACQVKVKTDVMVRIPEELLAAQEFTTTVEKIIDLTHDTKLLRFRLEEPDTISFKPGQYIQFQIPDTLEYRAYSVASPPSQEHQIELIVRLVPGGLCTTYIFTKLREGDTIMLTGPYGEFYLREDSDKDIICVAGGSGVAPIRCILTHLFEKGTPRKITYYFGARAVKDLYYYEECVKLAQEHENFTFIPALSEPDPGDQWDGELGFIHLAIEKYLDSGENKEAYLCGPPPMIDACLKVLKSKGVKDENIYFDKF